MANYGGIYSNSKIFLLFTMEATFIAAFKTAPYSFLQTFRNFVWF